MDCFVLECNEPIDKICAYCKQETFIYDFCLKNSQYWDRYDKWFAEISMLYFRALVVYQNLNQLCYSICIHCIHIFQNYTDADGDKNVATPWIIVIPLVSSYIFHLTTRFLEHSNKKYILLPTVISLWHWIWYGSILCQYL